LIAGDVFVPFAEVCVPSLSTASIVCQSASLQPGFEQLLADEMRYSTVMSLSAVARSMTSDH